MNEFEIWRQKQLSSGLISFIEGGDDDPPGGGGGGGGGGGDDALTKADVTRMINGAVNQRLKKFKDEMSGELDTKLETLGSSLVEKLKPAGGSDDKTGKGGSGGDLDKLPPAIREQMEAQRRQLEDMNSKLEEERKLRAKERERREQQETEARRKEERTTVSDALRKRGVADAQVPALAAYLHAEAGKVVRTEDGKIAWKTDDELDPHQPLDKGLEKFFGTDEGKAWLPPTGGKGSGNRGGGRETPRPKGDKVSLDDVGEQLEKSGIL